MLSGFLVWKITREKQSPPGLFLLHRVTRLVPLYTFFTLVFALYLQFTSLRIGSHDEVTVSHLLLSLAFIPHVSSQGASFPLLNAGWTLVLDMYYFLLFSLALLAPKRLQLALTNVIFILPACLHLFHSDDIFFRYYTNPIILSFLGGVWIAEAFIKRLLLPRVAAFMVSVLSAAAFVILVMFHIADFRFGILLWSITSLTAVYSMVSVESAGLHWLKLPGSNWIGRWSYSIYLAQSIAIPMTFLIFPGPTWVRAIAAVPICLAMGAAGHQLIEAPFNKLLRRAELATGVRASAISA